MLFTDGLHLVSDESEEELHEFAQRIGLKREWFQKGHYDMISHRAVQRALRTGAKLTGPRVIATIRRRVSGV